MLTRRVLAIAILGMATSLAGALAGCSPDLSPSPRDSASAATITLAATAPPSLSRADRIRIGLLDRADETDQAGPAPYPLSNSADRAVDPETRLVGRFLFNALYRLDASLTPVPDLVAKPCAISADGLNFTCTLRKVRFSNEHPVTADDVAFTYELARSSACPFDLGVGCGPQGQGLGGLVAGARALNPTTIQISLTAVAPTFSTQVLSSLWIDSREVVEGEFKAVRDRARVIGSKRLHAEATALQQGLAVASPDCESLRRSAEPLVRSAGIVPADPVIYDILPGASFDACRYVEIELEGALGAAADSLAATGMDAIAILYRYLPVNAAPVGTGAWSIDPKASIPGHRVTLSVSPGHLDDPPATPTIEFDIFHSRADAADAMRSGTLDWLPIPAGTLGPGPQALYRELAKNSGLKFAQYATPDLEAMPYNLDRGRLFADRNIRLALATCIDKPAIVDAATDGQGVPAYSTLPPNFWPSNPDLPIPVRDIAAAKALIESSGWQLQDGVYRNGSRTLGTDIWVKPGRPDRVKFVELLAQQARACGFDLRPRLDGTFLFKVECPPHIGPGTSVPADAWTAGGFTFFADPDADATQWESDRIGSIGHCDANLDGYRNPRVDVLVQQARSTYDILDRARAYREEQALLAQDPPMLFGWFRIERVALRFGMTSIAGPLRVDAPGWDWQLEQLVLER